MLRTNGLSETAVAVLRFEIRGYRVKDKTRQLPAYRELAAAGIMEPVPGSDAEYRFTQSGMEERQAILAQQEERIERERYALPETEISDGARALLRRVVAGERVRVDDASRPIYRELAAARIMIPISGFTTGPEASFRFTYWGWHRREELCGEAASAIAVPRAELP